MASTVSGDKSVRRCENFVCRPDIGPKHFDKLNSRTRPDPKSLVRLTTLPQPSKIFTKQADLSRTEQSYVGWTAGKVNTTDTRLDLLIASWITTYFACCRSTAVL